MPDPTKPPDWMAHQVMAQLDGVFPSAAEMHDAAVLAHYERRLTEDAATIADLRDRVRVLEDALRDIAGYEMPTSGSVAHQVCADMRDDARAALKGTP